MLTIAVLDISHLQMTDSTEEDNSYIYVDEINGTFYDLPEHGINNNRTSHMSDLPTTLHRSGPNTVRVSPKKMYQLMSRHTFCHSCITQALQSSSLCPIDRQHLSLDDVKSAPKIVASLVDELVVSCPRGCGVNVERACLKGHLNGTCDLEPILCTCGESITRRDQNTVVECEATDNPDISETSVGCIHEWQCCNDCSTRFQRLNRKVFPPQTCQR